MTSQNNTLRCAASTIYSMAGANMPSGAVNAPIEAGCFWSGSMVMLLLPRQLDTQRTKRLSRRARRRHQALASGPMVSFPGAPMNGAPSQHLPEASHHMPDGPVLILVKFRAVRPATAIPPRGGVRSGLTPLQCHCDVSRPPAGKVYDFDLELVSAGTEVLRPKLIDLLWHAGERVFPARLLLIDGAPLIRAQLIGEAMDLDLGLPVAHRALDDLDGALNGLFVGKARWLLEPVEQRQLLHDIACAGQQLVGLVRHVPSSSASQDRTSASQWITMSRWCN